LESACHALAIGYSLRRAGSLPLAVTGSLGLEGAAITADEKVATDSMIVKIAPNDRRNRMTSTAHRRFSAHEIAPAATPTKNTESPALAHPAVERHYCTR